jgi:hypothetical protein
LQSPKRFRGNVPVLSPQQLLFVDALLQGMGVSAAARYAKVDRVTGWRWWKSPLVRAEFDEHRHASRDLATARLQEASLGAVLGKTTVREAIEAAMKARSERTQTDADMVIQGLLKEARREGEGSSSAARVSAWVQLGKHLGMFTEKARAQRGGGWPRSDNDGRDGEVGGTGGRGSQWLWT